MWRDDLAELFQVYNSYIMASMRAGLLILDQHRAHQRILFEKYLEQQEQHHSFSQQELFPVEVRFFPNDASLLRDLLPDIRALGFTIEMAMHNEDTFIVSGVPAEVEQSQLQPILEEMIDSFKKMGTGIHWDKNTRLAASLAKKTSIQPGKDLQPEEMKQLAAELFDCKAPDLSPDGKPVMIMLSWDEIRNRFK